MPENDALTDYESSTNDLDSTQTLDERRHLSGSTPDETDTYVVDGSQQNLFGFTNAYQEILRSNNIEDVEFERAILSNCMPGGLLGINCSVENEND